MFTTSQIAQLGHSTGTDKFLSAQEYHSQMVFFLFKFNKFNIFSGP